MLLRALKDIPSSVSAIYKGSQFREPNPTQAADYIACGMAEEWLKPKNLNSRGWDGLKWDGATVVIIASGPSVTAEQVERIDSWRQGGALGERRVVVINSTFRLAPWADIIYGCDLRWWECKNSSGETCIEEAHCRFDLSQMWTTEEPAAKKYGIKFIKSARLPGLGKTPGLIHQGNNGGYQAINLAYQAGAKRIILLGFDMRDVDGKSHHHPDHPGLSAVNAYDDWIAQFGPLAADLKAEGVEVVNATPGSALKCFERAGLARALRGVKESQSSTSGMPYIPDTPLSP